MYSKRRLLCLCLHINRWTSKFKFMKLQFETNPELTEGFELPMLVDVQNITFDNDYSSLQIDGVEVGLDDKIIQTTADVIGKINEEVLPDKHFRDCVGFTMAMCGVWLPTHKPFDYMYDFEQVCDENVDSNSILEGPVSSGIPNDDRCVGFGDAKFVYSHMAFGLNTSEGNLFVYKIGVESEYCISSLNKVFEFYEHEVVHYVNEARVTHKEQGQLVSWKR